MSDTQPDHLALSSGSRLRSFQDLGLYRVNDILLVSTLYDSFILAEDGRLGEVMLTEFLDLDLHHAPRLTRVSTGAEALALARDVRRYDVVITSMHVGDMSASALAEGIAEAGVTTPVIGLAYDIRDVESFAAAAEVSRVDRVFLWQGDVRILLGIVKYVEDRMNVARDTGEMGVQAIILIEDSVRFYSSFLPAIYTELMLHSNHLLPDGMNRSHKLMRIQARPKILLCASYEEAWAYFERFQHDVLGVISDVAFPKGGEIDPDAGFEFARRVRERQPDVPIMLQSGSRATDHAARAKQVGASYVRKGSPFLLHSLRQFMTDGFGFGDFVFRRPDGSVVSVAKDLKQLEAQLREAPGESVAFHGERNHFSRWLKARTEFELAHFLRPRKVSDFETVEGLREVLIQAIHDYNQQRHRGIVADFDREHFDPARTFGRIGAGSLGGKGRGLAFANSLLADEGLASVFPEIRIGVPPAVVLGTEVFDRFLDANDLRDFAIACEDDDELVERFSMAGFPASIQQQLAELIQLMSYPLAIRSSSLLEDSPYQPFAGVYETVMLPNDEPEPARRLRQLIDAIKAVYVSMFRQRSKRYLSASPYRLEEEKMAVIIQKLIGLRHTDRFYPDVAGVARSHNYYPIAPIKAEDGVAAVALGLGATVADGEACLRFCPPYPKHVVQFSSVDDILRNSQRSFYALQLGPAAASEPTSAHFELRQFGLDTAEADGSLRFLGSTYSPENDAVYDGISRPGVRLVSFAPILKHGVFPLAPLLESLLAVGRRATGGPVEIEFACNLQPPDGQPAEFAFLQLRPLGLSRELAEFELGDVSRDEVVCASEAVLGNGLVEHVRDLVVVDAGRFDRLRTVDVAAEITRLNAALIAAETPYILIGVGRWGSRDRHLGVPVAWDQIAGARVIVEAGFEDIHVTPSQGSHFFQNITVSQVGYFTVNPEAGEGFVDWEWLAAQPAATELTFVRHIALDTPVIVKMNGKEHRGVILKPAPKEAGGRRQETIDDPTCGLLPPTSRLPPSASSACIHAAHATDNVDFAACSTYAERSRSQMSRTEHFRTTSGRPIDPVYGPAHLADLDYERDLNDPGQFPFTRGIHPDGYAGKLWTMRQFAGFGTPEETNLRYRHLLDAGGTGLSVAFDLPTLMGRDPDHPLSLGEVGKCGVSIASLADMERLFADIPLGTITTSMTINSPAAMLLAMYLVVAEAQGADWRTVSGTIQNDILKEYIAQKEYIYPPRPSMRLITDVFQFCSERVPRWNTISVSGYHIREAGSTALQELAFTLRDGIEYVQYGVDAGLDVDTFVPRMSFFFNAHNEFFEEIAKYRAARKLWSQVMRDRFGARRERSEKLRFHTQTAGVSLTAQQPYNNVVRTALQALAAVLGGTNSLHTCSLDEALALPSVEAATLALRTQQIIAHESGAADVADPLGGSYYIEALTSDLEAGARDYFQTIDDLGGMVAAIEEGYPQREIAESAYRFQQAVERGEQVVVGVNDHVDGETAEVPTLYIDESVAERQVGRLEYLRRTRDAAHVTRALDALKAAAQGRDNLMPPLLASVRAYATLGEMCNALRDVWGEYEETPAV